MRTAESYFSREDALALVGRAIRTKVEFSGVPKGTAGAAGAQKALGGLVHEGRVSPLPGRDLTIKHVHLLRKLGWIARALKALPLPWPFVHVSPSVAATSAAPVSAAPVSAIPVSVRSVCAPMR